MFDEVHRDGVPRSLGDGKLLKGSIWLMALRLGAHAGGTGFAVVLGESPHIGPEIFLSDKS